MMFRSTVNEDESGSDWDDLSPQHTPQRSNNNTDQAIELSSSAGRQPPHQRSGAGQLSLAQGQSRYEESPQTAGQPPHLNKVKGRPHSKKRSVQSSEVQQPSKHEMQLPINHPLPIEDQFTSVAMATPPQPHPPRTPAVTNPAYIVGRESPQLHHPPSPPLTPSHSHTSTPLNEEEPGYPFSSVSEGNAKEMVREHKSYESYMERIAEKSERLSQRCSAEVFSTLRIVTDWLITFLLACLHYTLYHVVRKLTFGLTAICSDSIFKPFLQCCFNACLWPLFSLAVQTSKACVLCVSPCVECCGVMLHHCAVWARACRLVEINTQQTTCRQLEQV